MIDALDIVTFRCGDWRVGGDAQQVRASRPAKAGDEALADLGGILGLPSGLTVAQVLTIKTAAGDREIRVSGPVELRTVGAKNVYPLPPLLSARTALAGLRALVLEDGALTLLVDLRTLVSSVPTEAS